MDLESELRKAMAEQVAEAAASPSLAADVRRRHRRRVTRIRTTMGVAAASVVAVALVPTYQSFRAAPAGAPETAAPSSGVSMYRQPERPPAPGVPASSPAAGKPGAGEVPGKAGAPPTGGPGGRPAEPGLPDLPKPPRWVTYLPGDLAAHTPCAVTGGAKRRTTVCTWRGGAGWVEITIVRGTGFGLEDLAPVHGVPGHASVRGTPAITGNGPGSGRQISWLARPGVGAVVQAGGGAENHLMRIAEGVRP
ncbi:hypothetical protein [Actinomadura macra]|uniref:hypothetical protein n=1 Tax=Actinomadura macra TaxID=46164 RepID=UPI00082BA958|nr:hypothetical protein [Actinomadura macra]